MSVNLNLKSQFISMASGSVNINPQTSINDNMIFEGETSKNIKVGEVYGFVVREVAYGRAYLKPVKLPLCDECKAMIHITQ